MDSKLPCVCSVTDHSGGQNVVRTSVTPSAAPRVSLFCSYHILTSSVIYYWTDARQLAIYLLIIIKLEYNARCLWLKERTLYEYKTRIWAKAVISSAAICTMSDHFPNFSAFLIFASWKWNFGTSEPTLSSNRRTKQRFVNMPTSTRQIQTLTEQTTFLLCRDSVSPVSSVGRASDF